MRRRFCALALSLSCLGAAGPVAADPSFDVIEPLPGNSHSQALGISADGCVVVGHSDGAAFRWRQGVTAPLVDDPEQNPHIARAVSDDGRVVGGGGGLQDGYHQEDAFLVAHGELLGITAYPGAVTSLSADGNTYAGYGDRDGAGHIYPFFSASNGFWLPAGSLGKALAISRDGLVAGGWSWQSPALWPASGGLIELGVLPGHLAGAVHALSADGSVAAGFTTGYAGQSEPRAVRWSGSALEDLGPLTSEAHAISGDGSLVTGEGPQGAFIWDAAHGARRLADVLRDEYGVDPGSFELLSTTAMGRDGKSFAGHGVDANGIALGWRVRLHDERCFQAPDFTDLLAEHDGEPAVDGLTQLVIDSQGYAYSNSGTSLVRVDPVGSGVVEVLNFATDGGILDVPELLGVGGDDVVYVGAAARRQLVRVSADGEREVMLEGATYPAVPPWPTVQTSPRDLAIAPDGTLFVAADARLLRIDPDGVTTELMNANQASSIARLGPPHAHSYHPLDDIALTSDGRLYVWLSNVVLLELDPFTGTVLQAYRDLPWVQGVVVGADGDLWVHGAGLARLRSDSSFEVLYQQGEIPDGAGGTLWELRQVIADESGNLYYVGASGGWLRLSPGGALREMLSPQSRYDDGEPLRFHTPLLVANGALYGIDDFIDSYWSTCYDSSGDYFYDCWVHDPYPAHIVRLPLPAESTCANGVDDDGDGAIDFPSDAGCVSSEDDGEHTFARACDNGVDEDHDGAADYPADPGCASPAASSEATQCDDGLDNDGDGTVDWDGAGGLPPDPECGGDPMRVIEHPWYCGLGFEVALLLPIYTTLRRWKRRL